jgi:hypothetical protein
MAGNRRFSKPIAMREGPVIATLLDALNFFETLPGEEITAPIYYARVVVSEALRSGRAKDVEIARLELERALRAGGRL